MRRFLPRIRGAVPRSVRELLDASVDGPVLSLFLDLDPSRYATAAARESQIRSLANQAHASVADRPSAVAFVDEAFDEVRAFVTGGDFPPPGAVGLAIFYARPDLFEVFTMRTQVGPDVAVAPGPIVQPLADHLSMEPRWGVLLVNKRTARLFVGPPDALRERGGVDDVVHGHHKQGGWSQARYQRSVEKEATDHVEHAIEALIEMDKRLPLARLAIGGPEEAIAELEPRLPKDLKSRLVGRIDRDVQHSSVEDVQRSLEPLAAADRARTEVEAIEELVARVGRGERSAVGLEAVRSALAGRRVERVLCQEGTPIPEDVLENALEQRAEVLVVHAPMGSNGPMAALLRF